MLGPPDERAHAWAAFRITTLLAGASSVLFTALYALAGTASGAVASAFLTVAAVALRLLVKRKHVETGMLALIAVALLAFVVVARDLGGLTSPAIVWLPLLLRATSQSVGRRVAVAGAALTTLAVVIIPFVAGAPVIAPLPLDLLRAGSVICAIAVAIIGAASNDRQRRAALAQLEEASRIKSDLLATVSHELRTPLHAIVGMGNLLLDSKLDDTQRDYTRTLHDAAESLVVLVDDLLETSQLEAGRVVLQPQPCALAVVVQSAVDVVAVRARAKGLTLTVTAPPDLPRVLADAGRLRQVLTNLVDNAVKFTNSGGVSVRVDVETADGNAQVRFSVTDTGIGIAPEKASVIFERFRQADSSTTRKYGGTGLGLAIARDLLTLMGGTISVSSMLGVGSTFTASVTLPLAPAVHKLDGTRVLLAEDNVVNQRLAVHLLQSLGCTVDVAHNGSEAVRMASAARYDVVLMDCHMPEMDGYRAAAAIRARSETATLPILALTAAGSADDVRRAKEAGMDALLQKPIDVEGIRTSLGAVVHAAKP